VAVVCISSLFYNYGFTLFGRGGGVVCSAVSAVDCMTSPVVLIGETFSEFGRRSPSCNLAAIPKPTDEYQTKKKTPWPLVRK
jgi:hypothetical protein